MKRMYLLLTVVLAIVLASCQYLPQTKTKDTGQEVKKEEVMEDPATIRDKELRKELAELGSYTRSVTKDLVFQSGKEYKVEFRRYVEHSEEIGDYEDQIYIIFYDKSDRILSMNQVFKREGEDVTTFFRIRDFDIKEEDIGEVFFEDSLGY